MNLPQEMYESLTLKYRAIIAESFERIHRSNLIGMGVLPLEFIKKENRKNLSINGSEKISISGIDKIQPNKLLKCKINRENSIKEIYLKCRIDTNKELDYYKSGGILQYVLNSIIKEA